MVGRRRHEDPDPRKFRRYSRVVVEALVEGEVWTDNGAWAKAVPSWAEIRSAFEHRGLVDSEGFLEVMDLERALQLLAHAHPDAAVVIASRMMLAFEPIDLESALGRHRNWGRLAEKGKAWLAAYLAGKDARAREAAYRRAH